MSTSKFADRVQETTTTTGTGTYSLLGALTGYQGFAAAFSTGSTVYYLVTDGTNWEIGQGVYTTAGSTLTRAAILASSNASAAVNWGTGVRYVFCTGAAVTFGRDGADVLTLESTTSTAYTDLTTAGPSVTLVTGTSAIVCLTCEITKTTAGNSGFMSFAVSGASSIAASDNTSASATIAVANTPGTGARVQVVPGLTAGPNIFTSKYRVDGGTLSFFRRSMVVFGM